MAAGDLILAIALILAIEGALYAAFPDGMKRMAGQIGQMPSAALRQAGLLAATVGVGIIWLVLR